MGVKFVVNWLSLADLQAQASSPMRKKNAVQQSRVKSTPKEEGGGDNKAIGETNNLSNYYRHHYA